MGKIVEYIHHEAMVNVDEDLKGKHREHCLCWRCSEFHPEDRENNCDIANLLYAVNVACGITTPVYECPIYMFKEVSENGDVETEG
jgi:hypothetical protein